MSKLFSNLKYSPVSIISPGLEIKQYKNKIIQIIKSRLSEEDLLWCCGHRCQHILTASNSPLASHSNAYWSCWLCCFMNCKSAAVLNAWLRLWKHHGSVGFRVRLRHTRKVLPGRSYMLVIHPPSLSATPCGCLAYYSTSLVSASNIDNITILYYIISVLLTSKCIW